MAAYACLPGSASNASAVVGRYRRLASSPRSTTSCSPGRLAAKIESVEIDHSHDPTTVSDHFPAVIRLKLCDPGAVVAGGGRVRMTSLLPNPPGDDTEHEEVSVKNPARRR